MVSLEKQSGLPITFDPGTLTLTFPDDVAVGAMSQRTFAEMRKFIANPDAQPSRDPIYTVWRRLSRRTDATRISGARLRYDLTLIPAGTFSNSHAANSRGPIRIAGGRRPEAGYSHAEFFRTAGHYHTRKPQRPLAFPEVYEVLYGRAYWIIQRPNPSDPQHLEEIYAVEAGPGEKAVMLPEFGHVSVNAFSEPLLMANWIDDAFEYDYAPYERFRGAGYWVTESPISDAVEFEKNFHYSAVPELKKLRPKELPEFGLLRSKPAYTLVGELEKLRFLAAPKEFTHILTLDHCYRVIL